MFQFIITHSNESFSICLIGSGQLKMEFRLEAACSLICLHLGNAKNYKNIILSIVRSTVKKMWLQSASWRDFGLIQILSPRCWDPGWVNPELPHKASITCLRKHCLMKLLGQAALGFFVDFFPHPSLKWCDWCVKGIFKCFLNEDTLFTFISRC